MKIIATLILFVCLTLTCSIHLNKQSPDDIYMNSAKDFKLLIFGDNGEIDYFFKKSFKLENKTATEEEKAHLRNAWYNDNLLAEKYKTDGYSCIVKNSNHTTNLVQKEGMVNFDNFNNNTEFNQLLNSSHKVVFLGDMIYPETKFLGIGGGDTAYVLENKPKWVERLVCSWNVFYRSLEKMRLTKISDGTLSLDGKVDFIAGNHSFDIDIHEEQNQVNKANKSNLLLTKFKETLIGKVTNKTEKIFTVHPRYFRIVFKTFIIKFIDFNSGLLQCAHKPNKAEYDICINKKFLPSAVSFDEAVIYYKRLYGAIKHKFVTQDDFGNRLRKDKNNTKITYWNVLRAHHPPANPEDGDEQFYFAKVPMTIEDKSKPVTQSLFDVMREAKVNIFLGSHVHNAAVIAIDYNTEAKFNWNKKDLGKQWGCYEAPQNYLTEVAVFKSPCSAEFKRSLKSKVGSKGLDVLYIFITGNSGRNYDAVRHADITNGHLIWSRATKNAADKFNYGFTYATFTDAKVDFDFYELDVDTNILVKGATFTVEKPEKVEAGKEDNKDQFLVAKQKVQNPKV